MSYLQNYVKDFQLPNYTRNSVGELSLVLAILRLYIPILLLKQECRQLTASNMLNVKLSRSIVKSH